MLCTGLKFWEKPRKYQATHETSIQERQKLCTEPTFWLKQTLTRGKIHQAITLNDSQSELAEWRRWLVCIKIPESPPPHLRCLGCGSRWGKKGMPLSRDWFTRTPFPPSTIDSFPFARDFPMHAYANVNQAATSLHWRAGCHPSFLPHSDPNLVVWAHYAFCAPSFII